MKEQLKTEQIFKKLTIPCNKTEMEELEESLSEQGCIDPIIIWAGVILDGHKRYRICMREEIAFKVTEMKFPSLEDAILWVCRRRTRHLAKSSLIYKYLVGKWYSAEIIINRRKYSCFPDGEIMTINDSDGRGYRTSRKMGLELGLNHATIELFKRISIALDVIFEKDPELFHLLMQGEYKVPYKKIIEMSNQSQRSLQDERRVFQRKLMRKPSIRKVVFHQQGSETARLYKEEVPISMGIKEMPAFDPEMELRGLALTLPTWMNAMERAWSKTDMTLVSDLLKQQLAVILGQFRQQTDQMMEVLINDPEQ